MHKQSFCKRNKNLNKGKFFASEKIIKEQGSMQSFELFELCEAQCEHCHKYMASGHVYPMLFRTCTCFCQPSTLREGKVRSTHDTCLPADKGNKQSKNIRHLGRSASKRRRTKHFSYGSKTVPFYSRQMEARWCVKWTLAGPKSKWKRWK